MFLLFRLSGQAISIFALSIIQALCACMSCVINVLTTYLYPITYSFFQRAGEQERKLPSGGVRRLRDRGKTNS